MHPFIALLFIFGLIALLFSLALRLLGGHKADDTPQDEEDPRITPQAAYNFLYLFLLRSGILLLLSSGLLYYAST